MSAARSDIVVTIDPEIADMVPLFLENRARDLLALREALARSDAEAVRRTGHRLRGVGGGYGFHGISEVGERIEEAAIAGQMREAALATEDLAEYLAGVRIRTG